MIINEHQQNPNVLFLLTQRWSMKTYVYQCKSWQSNEIHDNPSQSLKYITICNNPCNCLLIQKSNEHQLNPKPIHDNHENNWKYMAIHEHT